MSLFILIPVLVGGTGLFLTIKLRAFLIFHPIKCIKELLVAIKRSDNITSFTLALAGTLGVGNIFGVASAIIIGGAGSIFWLFVSAFLASAIKYSEAALTHGGRGMQDVIRSSFGRAGGIFSYAYMLLCIPLAFTMGAALQTKSIAGALNESIFTSTSVVVILVLLAVLPLMSDNSEKSRKISSKLVPLATIVYISMCFAAVFVNIGRMPYVISEIITGAFSFKSISGGIVGMAFTRALKEGFCTGILSNEAGAGTSSFAHTLLSDTTPHESGLFGALEVFFDTVVICPMTGLAILSSPLNFSEYTSAMRLASDCFAISLGAWSRLIFAAVVFVFAISTVLCWYYYGSFAYSALVRLPSFFFTVLFTLSLILGIFATDSVVISLTDLILLLMALPTLVAIIKSSDRIHTLSESVDFKKSKHTLSFKAGVFSISARMKASISKARSRPQARNRLRTRSRRPRA